MTLESRYEEILVMLNWVHRADVDVVWQNVFFLPQDGVSTLYVLGFSPYLDEIISWLDKESSRRLIILEDRVEAIDKMQKEGLDQALSHPQVKFSFRLENSWERHLLALAKEFPDPMIDCIDAYGDQEIFKRVKEILFHYTILESARFIDKLYYPRIACNVLANSRHLEEAFDVTKLKGVLQGRACILCGAGPSLEKEKEFLQKISDQAVIISVGTSVQILSNMEISPHLILAIDPNHKEAYRFAFHSAFETPFLFSLRVHPHVFQNTIAPLGYIPSTIGGSVERWIQQRLGITPVRSVEEISQEGMSASPVALKLALYFGCSSITFVGLDFCYVGGKRYPSQVLSNEQALKEEAKELGEEVVVYGKKATHRKWLMEKRVVEKIVQEHPSVTFFQKGEEGLPIEGVYPFVKHSMMVPNTKHTEQEIAELLRPLDAVVGKGNISSLFQELKESLHNVKEILQRPISNFLTKEVLLQEEISYQILCSSPIDAYKQLARRSNMEEKEIDDLLHKKLETLIEEYLHHLVGYGV